MKILDNFFKTIFSFFQFYSTDEIQKGLALFLIFFGLFTGLSSFYIYKEVALLVKNINLMNSHIAQVDALKNLNEKIYVQENEEQLFFTNNILGSSLKVFLEQAITKSGIICEPGWKESAKISKWFLDENFEEEVITLNINSILPKELVEFIQEMYKQPSIALREFSGTKSTTSMSVKLLFSHRYKKTV